jgi:hypothetical protein
MTQQIRRPGDGAKDFGLLSPCPVDAGWYERYWYSDATQSRSRILLDAVRQLRRPLSSACWTSLAICRGAFSSLDHGSATGATRQACEAGD